MLNEEKLMLLIKNALAEDIGDGDHSTLSSIGANATGTGERFFYTATRTIFN